jgi:PST family polysaccharide transporter
VASERNSVATRTLRGMFWAYGSYVAGRLLVLVSVALLARLLAPADFGLVALALTFTVVLDAVSDLGVSQALIIAEQQDLDDKADTAWTVSVAVGALLAVVAAALGPVAAAFFDEPALNVMLGVLGLNFLLRALGVTHFALAQRELDFRTRTKAELADVVVRGIAGVGLALAGAGAYSLVVGYLVGTAAMTATLWKIVPWRPHVRVHRPHLSGLLRFGGGLTALHLVSVVITNADYVLIGRVLGTTDLGFYTLGYRLPELVVLNLAFVAGLVLFPAFASVARAELARAFETSLRYTLIVGLPLTLCLSFLAEPLILLAFGDAWRDAIGVMQVLAAFAFVATIDVPAGTAYKSIGRVDILVWIAIPRAILVVVVLALVVDEGIVAVALCQTAIGALFALIAIVLASRLLGTGMRAIAAAAWPALVAGAAMALILAGASLALDDPYVRLAVGAPAAVLAYLVVLRGVAPDVFLRVARMLPRRS